MSTKPNILLVVIDCLRSDRVLSDEALSRLPTMQRLVSGGSAFSTLVTSNSMTTPCMTSFFSGLYPHTSGVRAMRGSRISDDVPLLAERLSAAGYHTYAETTGPLGPYLHLDRGFDQYVKREGVSESFLGAWGDGFMQRIASGDLTEPWFMYLHLWEVHMPRQVLPDMDAKEYGANLYDRAVASVDRRLGELLARCGDNTLVIVTGDHGEKTADSGVESTVESIKGPVAHALRTKIPGRWRQPYQKVVGGVRSSWFALSGLLYRRGLLDNPLSTITGHGFHVYDALTRVPLLIYGPGITQPGLVIDQVVRQIDIMPTLLDLVGASEQTPESIDGRSLKPLLMREEIPQLPAFIETCQNPSEPSDFYGVRTEQWKLACHVSDPEVEDELYDLTADPKEQNNIARLRPDVVAELRELLDNHLSSPSLGSVLLDADMSSDEMDTLADHLRSLGYVE